MDGVESPQQVGGTLIGKNGLVLMTGVEWYQTHGFQMFESIYSVLDIIMSRSPLCILL
jgi:hypothetical protein